MINSMHKALFLDRDGVINKDYGYVYTRDTFHFVDGMMDAVLKFQECGYLIFVITNQSGIGRGLYSHKQFGELTEWMVEQFLRYGVCITKTYYSPYHPEYGLGRYKRDSYCRKPHPGMICQAVAEYGVDLSQSILIGDKESDIEAGLYAGVKTTVLLVHSNDYSSSKADICVKNFNELFEKLGMRN